MTSDTDRNPRLGPSPCCTLSRRRSGSTSSSTPMVDRVQPDANLYALDMDMLPSTREDDDIDGRQGPNSTIDELDSPAASPPPDSSSPPDALTNVDSPQVRQEKRAAPNEITSSPWSCHSHVSEMRVGPYDLDDGLMVASARLPRTLTVCTPGCKTSSAQSAQSSLTVPDTFRCCSNTCNTSISGRFRDVVSSWLQGTYGTRLPDRDETKSAIHESTPNICMEKPMDQDDLVEGRGNILSPCQEGTRIDGPTPVARLPSIKELPKSTPLRDFPTCSEAHQSSDASSRLSEQQTDANTYNAKVSSESLDHRPGGLSSKHSTARASTKLVTRLSRAARNDSLKRRRSHLVDDAVQHASTKKAKLDRQASRNSAKSDHNPPFKANKPASLRRAQSLRSENSFSQFDGESSTVSLSSPSQYAHVFSVRPPSQGTPFPPTAPTTPLPDSATYARSKANPLVRTIAVYQSRSQPRRQMPPVPIIAPPPCSPFPSIKCKEDWAEERIKCLIAREREEREGDGLAVHDKRRAEKWSMTAGKTNLRTGRGASESTSSDSSDDGVIWEDESTCSASESLNSSDTFSIPRPLPQSSPLRRENRDIWACALGIDNDFRKQVTGWMLDVLPVEPQKSRTRHGSPEGLNLYDQLNNSPDTRFQAALIFHRYLLRVVGHGVKDHQTKVTTCIQHEDDDDNSTIEGCEDEDETIVVKRELISGGEINWHDSVEGCDALTWDIAVGCLALCVKLHRDVLPPLHPVYAKEFLELAPHSMTPGDLELAQRDIFSAFSFTLGSCTPQAILDEFWSVSPSLRKATASIRDGWAAVQREIWDKLFEAILEPDMLQFPVSVLTASAMLDSLVLALARQYKSEANSSCACHDRSLTTSPKSREGSIQPTSWQIFIHEAMQNTEDVVLDVKDVLQTPAMELEDCRIWLSLVGHE